MNDYGTLILTLFVLSMICERVADFLKNFLSEANSGAGSFIRLKLGIGNLLTKGTAGSLEEQRRAYRILKINLFCGFVTALALHANLFEIIKEKNQVTSLSWNGVKFYWPWDWFEKDRFGNGLALILGCFATGFFISFGSKFWHDLLDIIYQTKNYRRILADPDTFTIDNTQELTERLNTFPSTYVKAAFTQAQTKFVAMANIKSTSLKKDNQGFYIEVLAVAPTDNIQPNFNYIADNGQQLNLPVRITPYAADKAVVAHAFNLSSNIFGQAGNLKYGTFGCLVRPESKIATSRYILTCAHNVMLPANNILNAANQVPTGSESFKKSIGNVFKTVFDHEADGALIAINDEAFKKLDNIVPDFGQLQGIRDLTTDDTDTLNVYVCGAGTKHKLSGKITSVMTHQSIKYSGIASEVQLINLYAAANNGKAISNDGDSGCCVIDDQNQLIGLIVAGSISESYIIPIQTLFSKFSVQLVN